MKINLVANIDSNFGLGFKKDLLYKIPGDMKFFKKITNSGLINIVIMGRRTYESIGNTPLPNRINLVISSKNRFVPEEYKSSLFFFKTHYDVLEYIKINFDVSENLNICVIGGSKVYETFLSFATNLSLCRVYSGNREADTWFPSINFDEWTKTSETEKEYDVFYETYFNFQEYSR